LTFSLYVYGRLFGSIILNGTLNIKFEDIVF